MIKKKRKLSSYKKNLLIVFGSFGAIILLGTSIGVFGEMLGSIESKPKVDNSQKLANLPRVSSLESYWNSLKTTDLLGGKTSLKNFVNQNGAIFQNLIASEKYEATAALNQIVSTPKLIELNKNNQNRQLLKEYFKTQVRRDANTYYNYLTEPIEDADEFIARMNLVKSSYPEFYEKFVRARGQNYGIWVRDGYKSPESFAEKLPDVGENDERYVDHLYLMDNYRDFVIEKNKGAYASTLYNLLVVASAQQMGSVVKNTSPVTGGDETALAKSIKENRAYINVKYLAASILYGNTKNNAQKISRDLFNIALRQNAQHNDYKRHYLEMVACSIPFGWLFCGIPAVLATPSHHPVQLARRTYGRWIDTSKYNLDQIIKYGTYPIAQEETENRLEKVDGRVIYLPKEEEGDITTGYKYSSEASNWINELRDQANNGYSDSWSWTARNVWTRAQDSITSVDTKLNRRQGLSQAEADLSYLSSVYFKKISKEWKEEIDAVKNGNEKIYFNDIISVGKNSVVDLLKNQMMQSLFTKSMRGYWLELIQDLQKAIADAKKYTFHVQKSGTNRLQYTTRRQTAAWLTSEYRSWGGSNPTDELNDLDDYVGYTFDKVKSILSEDNRKRIFKKHIDEVWNQNKVTYERLIRNKLNEGRRDADVEQAKANVVFNEYLKDAYTDANFVIANPVVDDLNQESIPTNIGSEKTNFSIIPAGNLTTSPDGFDLRAEEVLDRYLTRNLTLTKLLEKDSGIGTLLADKSILVQQEYVNSLFALLKRDLFPYVRNVFDQFSNQNHALWDSYVANLRSASNKNLTPAEVADFVQDVLYSSNILHSNLLEISVESVSLAEGFLLDILEIKRFNDQSGTYKTLFEMIDDSEELSSFILNSGLNLLNP